MTNIELRELIERLRLGTQIAKDGRGYSKHRSTALEREAATALQSYAARVKELEGTIETAAKAFRRYAELHRMKGTTEGNLKASNNDDLAEFCEAALPKQSSDSRNG